MNKDKLDLVSATRGNTPSSTGSYFDDKPITYAAFQVLYYFLGLFSATTLTPLTTYLSAKRRVAHTVINGKRLYFDGKLYQIYGHYCLWVLLSFATLFIYTFFIAGETRKWVSKHTYFADEYNKGTSFYSGDPYESVIVNTITSIIKYGSLGILSPKAKVIKDEMMTKRYTYSGHKLLYVGGFEGAMGFGVRNILLNLCTFGVYGLIEGCYLED